MNLDLTEEPPKAVKPEEEPIIFAPKTYQYDKSTLNEVDIKESPIEQFLDWFKDAENDKTELIPESVVFSTARLPSGRISSRVVLFKELDLKGFIIFSNFDTSKKEKDIATNKYASLTFFWRNLQRQVRVEGIVERVDYKTSQNYFNTRPRGSKIGAYASPQSKVIKDREELENYYEQTVEKFKDLKDDEIECPLKWGGLRIIPLEIEFWQGRKSRLHDRLTYRREDVNDTHWKIVRLAP